MKLPLPQKDGLSVLIDTYSNNEVPLDVSQVEIIVRGSDIVLRTKDGAELILVQAAQISSMHENVFNLVFKDGTTISSNELFQRVDAIEAGPEMTDNKEDSTASQDNTDPVVVVVDSPSVSVSSTMQDNAVSDVTDSRVSVAQFNEQKHNDFNEIESSVSSSKSSPPPEPPVVEHKNDNEGEETIGLRFVEKVSLYQIGNGEVTDKGGNTVWQLGGGSSAATTNPALDVQYNEKAVLDLRGKEGEQDGFTIRADNEAFKYGQGGSSSDGLDHRLGRIISFDSLFGGVDITNQSITAIQNIPNGMNIIWKGGPGYDEFVAKYGIELKGNEVFINYRANVDFVGSSITMTMVDSNGKKIDVKTEFTNQYAGDHPDKNVNSENSIVLSKTPNEREIIGGSGNDTIYASQFHDKITYDGAGGDKNRLIFDDGYILTSKAGSTAELGLTFDLKNEKIIDEGSGEVAVVKNIQQFIGTRGDDHFIMGNASTSYYFDGREGNNVFDLQWIDQNSGQITGSSGNNELFGGVGKDTYNLQKSSGENTINDKGGADVYNFQHSENKVNITDYGADGDQYNFSDTKADVKIIDDGGEDKYEFYRTTGKIDITDEGNNTDYYYFDDAHDATVKIVDNGNADGNKTNDIYNFKNIIDTDVEIQDARGDDTYEFSGAKGGHVNIKDVGEDGDYTNDKYNFDKTAIVKTTIVDTYGDENYNFSGSQGAVYITDQEGNDSYIFNGFNGNVKITDISQGKSVDYYDFSYSKGSVEIFDADMNSAAGGADTFYFRRSEGTNKITDKYESNGRYYFQYSKGDNTIINEGGFDTYYLSGSTGNFTITGGTGVDVVFAGLGGLEYDGGAGEDWISFQPVYENGVDSNARTEGVYVNLETGAYSDFSKVQSHNANGAVVQADDIKGKITNVEYLIGSKFSDLIYGRDGDDYFFATEGNDIYYGGKGSDTYYVGSPNKGGITVGLGDSIIGAWAGNPTIGTSENIVIDLDQGYATTLWGGRDTLHDIENAYGALDYKNIIIGRWGTDGNFVGGNKEDVFYSVENSKAGGITRIDGMGYANDTIRYDYESNGKAIKGIVVTMGGDTSGETVKGIGGQQGKDIFENINEIYGTKENDTFYGHASGGHKFHGNGGNDIFYSKGGAGSVFDAAGNTSATLDYSALDNSHGFDFTMNGALSGTLIRDKNIGQSDIITNVTNLVGTQGNDVVHFGNYNGLISFDGQGGQDWFVKNKDTGSGGQFTISGGFKNVEGIGFIDNHKDVITLDMDGFFAEFTKGVADADGKYHAHFYVDDKDEFNIDDKAGGWTWKETSNDGHGNKTWTAYDDHGANTGHTIDVTVGSSGDGNPQ